MYDHPLDNDFQILRNDMNYIHCPELSQLKEFLLGLGATLPDPVEDSIFWDAISHVEMEEDKEPENQKLYDSEPFPEIPEAKEVCLRSSCHA